MDNVRIFVGYDPREAIAYHVFAQSVIEHSSVPVSLVPLAAGMLGKFNGQRDGSNAFTFSRYLIPYLCDFIGWAIFCDGDMVVTRDIVELWNEKEHMVFNKAVALVKHDYKTRHPRKYVGTTLESRNIDYPRKNWSSVVLWNCSHAANKVLTPEYVGDKSGDFLHRFQWLSDDQIASLPPEWNVLVREDPPSGGALFHYTLGIPGFDYYKDDYGSWHWHGSLVRALRCGRDKPSTVVKRAEERVGGV